MPSSFTVVIHYLRRHGQRHCPERHGHRLPSLPK
jgi:hypothetical protein